MDKQGLLQKCIDQGNEYGYISWDGILDICDEKQKKIRYCVSELERMRDSNEITFELDF